MTATAATKSTECGVGGVGVAPKVFTCGVTPRTIQKFDGETLAYRLIKGQNCKG